MPCGRGQGLAVLETIGKDSSRGARHVGTHDYKQANPASVGIHRLSTEGILHVMNDLELLKVPKAVRAETPRIAQAVERIVEAIRQGGRMFFLGAGTSGRLCVLEAAECPPTFGIAQEVVQAVIAAANRRFPRHGHGGGRRRSGRSRLVTAGFHRSDVLVGISASGESVYVVGAVEHAQCLGALTIGISCNPTSALARSVRIPITPHRPRVHRGIHTAESSHSCQAGAEHAHHRLDGPPGSRFR